MITLLTGFPGNGKTLYLLDWIERWAKQENRPVYFSGIEFTPAGLLRFGEWIEFEPMKWNECPPGAIVVIDECQRIFRNRSINAVAPKFVTDLETHRHLGIDLVFITQHPMLVDPALRRLTGQHLHAVRTFGMEGSVIHEWPQVRENCDKPVGRKDSTAKPFKFNKSLYGLYKSAEQHTMKRNIPWKIKMLFILPLVLAGLVYLIYNSIMSRIHPESEPAASKQQASGFVSSSRKGNGSENDIDPIADARKYVFESTPRIVGMPHTAPKYDGVTAPITAPVPVSCVASKTKCNCYSQQATIMDVSDDTCRTIVARGFFVDFKANPDVPTEHRRDFSDAYLVRADSVPVVPDRTAQVPPVASADGYGVLGRTGAGVRRPGDADIPSDRK